MWDYIAFFGYNFLFFLFALLIWYIFPRPTPYDYTTIPGLKIDPTAAEEGNLREMRDSSDLASFLDQLHADYGALASFYWGQRYVVAVGNVTLWHDLLQWSQKIVAHVDIIPSSESAQFSLKTATEILQEMRNGRRVNGDDEKWEVAIRTVLNSAFQKDKLAAIGWIKLICSKYEEALIRNSYNNVLPSLDSAADGDSEAFLREALLCQALEQCLSCDGISSLSLLDLTKLRLKLDAKPDFSELGRECLLRSVVLETIRFKTPFQFIFYTFEGEIDLEGHPIPAGTPIILHTDVLNKRSNLKDSEKFMPDRFLQKSTTHLSDCIISLPQFDLLASVLLANFGNGTFKR